MSSSLTVILYLMLCGSTATLNDYFEEHERVVNQTRPIYTLATPRIIYSADRGNSVFFPGNLALRTGEKYIVGYIKTLKVFNYIGCIPEPMVFRQTVRYTDIPSDPGQCFSVCGGNYKVFGISKTTCFCLEGEVINRFTRCTIECTSPNNTVCGGHFRNKDYLSVYEYVNEMAGRSDGNFCLAHKLETYRFFWDNCGDKNYGSCQLQYWDGSFVTDVTGTWKEYVNMCFNKYNALIDIGVPIVYVDGENGLWTGRIRSWVIEKSTGASSADIKYGYAGYVTSEGGTYRLGFSEWNGNIRWKLVCVQDDPYKSPVIQPISEPITSASTTENGIHVQTSTHVTDSQSMQTPTEQLSSLSNNHMSSVNENTKDKHTTPKQVASLSSNRLSDNFEKTTGSAMLAVYVVSPCVLIAVVVVGTICFIKRRRRRNDDAYVDTGIRFNNTKPTPGVANAAYDGNAIQTGPEKVPDHSYWVLEKEPDNAVVCPDDDVNDYDMTNKTHVHNDNDGNVYNTLEASSDDTYDHTVDIVDKIKNNNDNDGNVYNILEASSDDTYDHTGYEINRIKNIDDTYNHAGNECDTENEYSTANKWTDTRDSEQKFDDTYNHI